jgi:Flp pilus assembly protein CpaB
VARVTLSAGTSLRASLLEVRAPDKSFEWKGHLRPVDLVHFAGQRLRRELAAGEAIRKSDLETDSAAASQGGLLPAGARSVTLRIDWVGGRGTWVQPGDHVDIGLVREGKAGERPSVIMLMQDARILMAQAVANEDGPPARAPWVSVLALPREAAGLALAQRLGHIVLFPRGAQGPRTAIFPPVTLEDLVDPAFWQRLHRQRQRTIGPSRAPDDPGIRVK